jgi:long-chain acyl-CoA synthetase
MQLASLVERAARRQPDKTATVYGTRQQTWRQLVQRSSRLAGALCGLGLVAGDRLAILALNSDRYLETQIAALWAGAVFLPLNTMWSIEELLFVIEDTSPHLLLVDDACLEQAKLLKAQSRLIRKVIHMGDTATAPDMLDYEVLIAGADMKPVPTGTPSGDDLFGIYYTGGTTGFPKGVMLSHSSLLHSGLYSSVDMGYSSDEIYLHAAPMFHLADFSQTVANTLFGITHCFVPTFEAESTLQAIESMGVTSLSLLPSMMQRMIEHPRFEEFDLSSLRRIIYGDSPISPTLGERALRAFPDIELFQAYGLTEMGPLVTILRPEDHRMEGALVRRRTSVGRPMVGVEVRIVDAQFNQLATGEVGLIIASGKNAMLGYWNRPDETAKALIDGWVVTGDLGHIDSDGYLYLADRSTDVIVVDGEVVFSIEVENALISHPAVQSIAVIGIPAAETDEAVHAIVIADPDSKPTERELIEHCKALLAVHKCPRSISFRDEPMPLSAPGKVLKTELRKPYWEGR